MRIEYQIKALRRIKADLQKDHNRANDIIKADLEGQIQALDAAINTLTRTEQILQSLRILQGFE